MIYKPPKFGNKFQWVPIVAKNKDWLIGYISGIQLIESLVINNLKENGIFIDLRGIEFCLDSSRFNDILENDKKESECSEDEIKKYYNEMVEEKMNIIKEKHPDNNESIFFDCFLEVECSCGLGVFSFKTANEIPEESFKCQICGRTVIDYTHQNDEEFEFDGNISTRLDQITKEIEKTIDKEVQKTIEEIEDEEDEEENLF